MRSRCPGLNWRPTVYETVALPLSYTGTCPRREAKRYAWGLPPPSRPSALFRPRVPIASVSDFATIRGRLSRREDYGHFVAVFGGAVLRTVPQ